MALIELLDRLISERGSAAALRERLALVRDQAEVLEKKLVKLEEENRALKERLGQVEDELKAKTAGAEFVEHWGALFKRKPAGGYHQAVFCPDCRGPMFSLQDVLPFHCDRCKRSMNFTGHQLLEVMRDLPR